MKKPVKKQHKEPAHHDLDMSTISIGHLDGASAPDGAKKNVKKESHPILQEKTIAAAAAPKKSERAKTVMPPQQKPTPHTEKDK